MKPVASPMRRRHDRLVDGHAALFRDAGRLEHPLVVLGHDLGEVLDLAAPPLEDPVRDRGTGLVVVAANDVAQELTILVLERVEIDHLAVEARWEDARGIVHVRDPTGHPGPEVPTRRPEHDDASAGHVLTAMVTD